MMKSMKKLLLVLAAAPVAVGFCDNIHSAFGAESVRLSRGASDCIHGPNHRASMDDGYAFRPGWSRKGEQPVRRDKHRNSALQFGRAEHDHSCVHLCHDHQPGAEGCARGKHVSGFQCCERHGGHAGGGARPVTHQRNGSNGDGQPRAVNDLHELDRAPDIRLCDCYYVVRCRYHSAGDRLWNCDRTFEHVSGPGKYRGGNRLYRASGRLMGWH